MLSINVTLNDSATPKVAAVENAYRSGRHLKIMAASGAKVVKDHFTALDQRRHRSHSKFHFYAKAVRATKAEVRAGVAVVNIDHEGIALRRFGGTVRPRVAKYLTIQVDPVADGRRVREFGDTVRWIINRRTGKGVVTLGGRVIYAITQESEHKADPSVLPEDGTILDQVTDDLRVWTDLQESRG